MISIIIGVVLGAAVGILNFKILLYMTGQISRFEPKKAGFYAMGGFALRTVIYVAFILAAVYVDQINVFGAAAGLMAASILNLRERNRIIKDVSDDQTN